MLTFLVKGGKTQANGKAMTKCCIRNAKVELYPHSALSMHFFCRFVLDNEPFPDPRDPEAWNDLALWAASDPLCNMTYQEAFKTMRNLNFNSVHLACILQPAYRKTDYCGLFLAKLTTMLW